METCGFPKGQSWPESFHGNTLCKRLENLKIKSDKLHPASPSPNGYSMLSDIRNYEIQPSEPVMFSQIPMFEAIPNTRMLVLRNHPLYSENFEKDLFFDCFCVHEPVETDPSKSEFDQLYKHLNEIITNELANLVAVHQVVEETTKAPKFEEIFVEDTHSERVPVEPKVRYFCYPNKFKRKSGKFWVKNIRRMRKAALLNQTISSSDIVFCDSLEDDLTDDSRDSIDVVDGYATVCAAILSFSTPNVNLENGKINKFIKFTEDSLYSDDEEDSFLKFTEDCTSLRDDDDNYIMFMEDEESDFVIFEDEEDESDDDDIEDVCDGVDCDIDEVDSIQFVNEKENKKEHIVEHSESLSRDECDSKFSKFNNAFVNSSTNDLMAKATRKVHFPADKDLCQYRHLIHWSYAHHQARKGHWHQIALDGHRFQRRISNTAAVLNPILESFHRQKIYNQRFSE